MSAQGYQPATALRLGLLSTGLAGRAGRERRRLHKNARRMPGKSRALLAPHVVCEVLERSNRT